MRKELTPEERYEIGERIGKTIIELFGILAKLDNVTLDVALDGWIAEYIIDRIHEENG